MHKPGKNGFACQFQHQKRTPLYLMLPPVDFPLLAEISLVHYLLAAPRNRYENQRETNATSSKRG